MGARLDMEGHLISDYRAWRQSSAGLDKDNKEQWKEAEDPEMSLHNYNHRLFDKDIKNTWGENSIFQ